MDFVLCYACQSRGACQFGVLEQTFPDAESSVGRIRCPDNFQGLPKMAHGGWISAVLDDVMGRLAWKLGEFIHTTSLTIEFLKPVPTDEELGFTLVSKPTEPGRWRLDAELFLADTGLVLARAHGGFVQPKRRRPTA